MIKCYNNSKAISAIVGISLLLIVTILTIIGFQSWHISYQNKIFSNVESNNNDNIVELEDLMGNVLYVENNFHENFSVIGLNIGGSDCDLNENLSVGINEIDISNCFVKSHSSILDVVIITEKDLISKQFFVGDDVVGSRIDFRKAFISVWNTSIDAGVDSTSLNDTIILPLQDNGNYNFTVYWGDGKYDNILTYDQAEKSHTYANPGTYEVKIIGKIIGFSFNAAVAPWFLNSDDGVKIINIKQWGVLNLGNNGDYFSGCENLIVSATDNLNLSGTTNLAYMFYKAFKMTGNFNNWDVSQVTNLQNTFSDCDSFDSRLDDWNVSKVTNMGGLFEYQGHTFNGNLSKWDVSQVTNMQYMFRQVPFNFDISNWNVSKVTNMDKMFMSNTIFNQNLSSWDVDQVTSCTNFNLSSFSWVLPKPSFSNC